MFKKCFIIGILLLCFCFFMSGVSAESFTYNEMASSAEDVARYTLNNSKIPKSVTINGKTAKDEDYLNMLTNTIVKISNGNKAGSTIPSRSAPSSPSGTSGGTLTKSQYLTMAKNINSYYSINKRAPNYATINGKNVRYESLVYGFSKVLYAYERDGTLPSDMSFPLVSGISSSGVTVDTTPPSTSRNLNGG
jgi:amino acid transporter